MFYREKHFVNYQYTFALFCDGKELTPSVNGSYLRVTAAVGKHSCVAESLQRAPTEIQVTAGSVVYLRVYIDLGKRVHAVLVNSSEAEFEKHERKLIALAPVHLSTAETGTEPVKPPSSIPSQPTRQMQAAGDAGRSAQVQPSVSAPDTGKTKAAAPAPAAAAEIASQYESTGDNAVLLIFYRKEKEGDKYISFAVGELKGKIAFNSKGILGNVDGLQRLQFAVPKDKWLAITQRSVEGGKAVVTTEDGKSYKIFNFGLRAFAAQIEAVESSPSSSTSEQNATTQADAAKPSSTAVAPAADSRSTQEGVSAVSQGPEQQAFSAAAQSGTAEAWQAFLKRYPAGKLTQEARRALDSDLYREALLVQSDARAIEAIFRRCKTPEGADKVFALWDEAAYQAAKELGTADGYRSYTSQFPKGAHVGDAEAAMDTLAWQPCSDKDVESCRKYVKQYLHGLHDKGAREKITESEFEQAKAQDTIEGYEKFLGQHPNHAPALARLRDLLYERATSTGELADWQKFREWNYVSTSYEPASKDRLAYALKEIERLMYAEIVAGATLKECQEYLSRYREGVHAQQVRVALDPLLFENAKKANTIRDYKEYLQEYPQGSFTTEAQSLLDPLLFEWATKEDWHSSYEEYLRFCATCSNAEKAKERLAALQAVLAIPTVDFPAELVSTTKRWEWDTVFKETGGKIGYRVEGTGYIITPKGDRYVSQFGRTIARGTLKITPGGSAKDNYWVSSNDGEFCDGYAVFDWSGEDAGGKAVNFVAKVHLKCGSNPSVK
jgi:hypothetical protein